MKKRDGGSPPSDGASITARYLTGEKEIAVLRRRREPRGFLLESTPGPTTSSTSTSASPWACSPASRESPARGKARFSMTSSTGAERRGAGRLHRYPGLERPTRSSASTNRPSAPRPRSIPAHVLESHGRDPRPVQPDPEAKLAGLKPGDVFLQHQGRPVRGLRGGRVGRSWRCSSCPTSFLSARASPGEAVQARSPRDPLIGERTSTTCFT